MGHALFANFSHFGTPFIFRLLGVFGVDFCLEYFCCGSRDVFCMLFNILIFYPNWRFCKGYGLCIIANFLDFGTLVIFWILGVFGVDFCLEDFYCASGDLFRMFLNISIFDSNWRFCKGYSPCDIANFFRFWDTCYFSTIRRFWSGFLLRIFLLWF